MKKKEYNKPTMRVVQLKQRQRLLAGSVASVRGMRNGYGDAKEQNWNE